MNDGTCFGLSSCDLELLHNASGLDKLMDNEESIVWHESIFDQYSSQLEAGTSKMEINSIKFENIEMKKEHMASLVTALSGQFNKSKTIQFNNVNLCKVGVIYLSKLVYVSYLFQALTINHNRIDNMELAHCLSRSIKSHTCINRLCLNHCDLGSSPEILLVILQSDTSLINLNCNNIDSLGAVTIAEYLEGDLPIHRIDLYHNCLNDDDVY